jgi:hypothetical protein
MGHCVWLLEVLFRFPPNSFLMLSLWFIDSDG